MWFSGRCVACRSAIVVLGTGESLGQHYSSVYTIHHKKLPPSWSNSHESRYLSHRDDRTGNEKLCCCSSPWEVHNLTGSRSLTVHAYILYIYGWFDAERLVNKTETLDKSVITYQMIWICVMSIETIHWPSVWCLVLSLNSKPQLSLLCPATSAGVLLLRPGLLELLQGVTIALH